MVEAIGYFCFYLFGILLTVCSVTGSHRRHSNQMQYNYHYYYYYYYEYDGNASMIAGSIIGGLIALCIIIAVIVVIAHACNCCKTHGIRGHTVRPSQISTVTTTTPYNNMPQNNWYYLPATAPPYNPNTTKPPEYSIDDSHPPPAYEDVSRPTAPANTSLQQPGISSPAPPYSPPRPTLKS